MCRWIKWLSGVVEKEVKASLNKYFSPKTLPEIPLWGNPVKHSFGQRVYMRNPDITSSGGCVMEGKAFWLLRSAFLLRWLLILWTGQQGCFLLCKMRSRSTWPLCPISITVAVGLWVIDPITTVGWPVSNSSPPWFPYSVQLSSVLCGPLDGLELAVDLWKLYESGKFQLFLFISLYPFFFGHLTWISRVCFQLESIPGFCWAIVSSSLKWKCIICTYSLHWRLLSPCLK